MTCEEFAAIRFVKLPEECTRAERLATLNHVRSCASCHAKHSAALARAEAESPPLTEEEGRAIDLLAERDKQDPEVHIN